MSWHNLISMENTDHLTLLRQRRRIIGFQHAGINSQLATRIHFEKNLTKTKRNALKHLPHKELLINNLWNNHDAIINVWLSFKIQLILTRNWLLLNAYQKTTGWHSKKKFLHIILQFQMRFLIRFSYRYWLKNWNQTFMTSNHFGFLVMIN